MPHYADGTEVKVGDQVTGHLKNTPGVVAGTVISITPGTDFCNAMVQFTLVQPEGEASPRMALSEIEEPRRTRSRAVRGEAHGSAGPTFIAFDCADYVDTKELTKVGP